MSKRTHRHHRRRWSSGQAAPPPNTVKVTDAFGNVTHRKASDFTAPPVKRQDKYVSRRENKNDPLNVECPRCHVPRGYPCRSREGYERPPHDQRKASGADPLT